ncbi:MAG: hypothetical protein Q8O30_07650 [Candidatus Omnitrophota bacterium]|nr:hypothetical protein [Candidatus Omnitrophota bacterium]
MHIKWSPPLAYVVGLITTDGSLSNDERHIVFTSSDIQLIKTFKECLRLKNKITLNPFGQYAKRQSYKIQFSSIALYSWLLKIGLTPNKTKTIKLLRISDKYFPDFIRGHIDGDGSIFIYRDSHNKYKRKTYSYQRLYVTLRSSSKSHMEWIRDRLKTLLGIKGSLSGWKPKERKIKLWSLRFCKKESLKILPWLYYKENLPCLNRKFKIAKNFL